MPSKYFFPARPTKFSTVFGASPGYNSASIVPSVVSITATTFPCVIGFLFPFDVDCGDPKVVPPANAAMSRSVTGIAACVIRLCIGDSPFVGGR